MGDDIKFPTKEEGEFPKFRSLSGVLAVGDHCRAVPTVVGKTKHQSQDSR
jgi:hypothetical protein